MMLSPRRGLASIAIFVGIASVTTAVAGSLYKADSYQALTSDSRSFRIGDALTVLIVEASSAESRADSTATRDTSVSATARDSVRSPSVGLELRRDSTGRGDTTRTGNLQAQISVRVQNVAANGDLIVHGTQKITVNGETQMIAVAGIVRPIDVSSDNVVLSTRLTNAEITYSGRGFVDRSQSESWISRLLGVFGL